jgi:hypothetical protein
MEGAPAMKSHSHTVYSIQSNGKKVPLLRLSGQGSCSRSGIIRSLKLEEGRVKIKPGKALKCF